MSLLVRACRKPSQARGQPAGCSVSDAPLTLILKLTLTLTLALMLTLPLAPDRTLDPIVYLALTLTQMRRAPGVQRRPRRW